MRNQRRTPTRQESRIGVKGDPTPDAEYGDDPERPSGYSESNKFLIKCVECENQRKVTQEEFEKINSCMRMTFNPEKGEVPCGGEMVKADE